MRPFIASCALFLAFPAAVVLSGCGGLSSDDATLLRHAATLNGMAYTHEDPTTPNAALERGAFCTTAAVLQHNQLAVPDAGISCEMTP